MSTNDPSKTMFGQSPFKAMDDSDAESEEPKAPAAPAVTRSKASLFFDEDGWDVPEERISGSFAVAREGAKLNTSEVAESLGLEDVPPATLVEETEIERPFSGTMRFRPEDLSGIGGDAEQSDEVIEPSAGAAMDEAPSTPGEPESGARPFGGTMMFSAQDIVGALDEEGEGESRELRPYEQDVRRATTQERAGIDVKPAGEREFSGTMRFRPEDLAEMGSGNKATTEVDLRALAYTTGAPQVVDEETAETETASEAAMESTAGVADAPDTSGENDQPHVGLPADESTDEDEAEPITNRTMMGISPFFVGADASEPAADATPAAPVDSEPSAALDAEAGGETASQAEPDPSGGDAGGAEVAAAADANPAIEGAQMGADESVSADASADSQGAGPDADSDESAAPATPVPVIEEPVRRAPAVTQPTQLMPALTMPETIAGETDALLNASNSPSESSTLPSKEGASGSPIAMIAVVVLITLVILVLAAMLVLR